ncbi:MAG TPA: methylmalonyl Co-A mutase-associated GTPase MeaB [Nitrospiraceae bacterium]|nr:methylmalonyl Co-A mutase-associated GTPase MeaB [Nitrospiraceae bacterium]
MQKLIQELLKGSKNAAARLISIVENENDKRAGIVKALKPHTGRAHIVGITGAPGSGKSTLISGLTGLLRAKKKKVGVIAVDPTSPVTGGALLGDRIRMLDHFLDTGVFIRSMAVREGAGGLSKTALPAAAVLDAFGTDVIFIETAGVGQSETAVKGPVHTVVVVLTPNLGDDVQMMKAGIMEIGDVFVINKGDLKNAAGTARELEQMLLLLPSGRKKPSVLVTAASEGKGIDSLLAIIEKVR